MRERIFYQSHVQIFLSTHFNHHFKEGTTVGKELTHLLVAINFDGQKGIEIHIIVH